MAGTTTGGKKAAESNKARDPDFYRKIGAKGGANSHTGGFAHDSRTWLEKLLRKPKLAQVAGRKGGMISKRGKAIGESDYMGEDEIVDVLIEFAERVLKSNRSSYQEGNFLIALAKAKARLSTIIQRTLVNN